MTGRSGFWFKNAPIFYSTGIVENRGFLFLWVFCPHWRRSSSTPTLIPSDLYSNNPAHSVVKRQSEHLNEEVDGVSRQKVLGPSPIGLFFDEFGIGLLHKVIGSACDPFELLLRKQGGQRR